MCARAATSRKCACNRMLNEKCKLQTRWNNAVNCMALSVLNLDPTTIRQRCWMLKLMADTTRTFRWKRSAPSIEIHTYIERKFMAIRTHDLFITVQCDAIDCSSVLWPDFLSASFCTCVRNNILHAVVFRLFIRCESFICRQSDSKFLIQWSNAKRTNYVCNRAFIQL